MINDLEIEHEIVCDLKLLYIYFNFNFPYRSLRIRDKNMEEKVGINSKFFESKKRLISDYSFV